MAGVLEIDAVVYGGVVALAGTDAVVGVAGDAESFAALDFVVASFTAATFLAGFPIARPASSGDFAGFFLAGLETAGAAACATFALARDFPADLAAGFFPAAAFPAAGTSALSASVFFFLVIAQLPQKGLKGLVIIRVTDCIHNANSKRLIHLISNGSRYVPIRRFNMCFAGNIRNIGESPVAQDRRGR